MKNNQIVIISLLIIMTDHKFLMFAFELLPSAAMRLC